MHHTQGRMECCQPDPVKRLSDHPIHATNTYPDLVTAREVVVERMQQLGSSWVCPNLHELDPKPIVLYVMTVKTTCRINDNTLEISLVGYVESSASTIRRVRNRSSLGRPSVITRIVIGS